MATTTLNSSDEHPEKRSQLRSSIASAPSAPAAPESFDVNHVTSYSVKLRGTVSGTSSQSSKAAHVGFSTGGHACPGASPGGPLQPVARFLYIVHQGGDPPPPLPVGFLTDSLPELNRKHCVMVNPGFCLLPPLPATGGPALPGAPLRLGVPH